MFKFSSKLILRTDVPKKDGTCLLCLQVFINGKRIVESLSIYLPSANFNAPLQEIVYSKESPLTRQRIKEVNNMVELYINRMYNIRHKYESKQLTLSVSQFRSEFRMEYAKKDFYDFIEKEIETLKPDREHGTIKHYNKVLRKLKDFKKSLYAGDLTFEFLQGFEMYLIKNNLDVNTRWSVHKTLKFFINSAIKKCYPIENPYSHFKTYSAETDTVYLDTEEMLELIRLYYRYELVSPLQNVLRYFLFSCLAGGLRISDVKRLNQDNIIKTDLVFYMYKNRRKKRKKVTVPLTQNALRLVDNIQGKLFVTYSDNTTNKYLKDIAVIANLRKKLTFHVARHTFATQFLLAGGKIETLQKLLAHSKIETTMRYVHIIDNAKREQMLRYDERLTAELVRISGIGIVDVGD